MMRTGTPPTCGERLSGLKTQTSARGTPGVVSCGSPAPGTPLSETWVSCWPRWAAGMKALAGEPAKTMSRGSSPTSKVRTTRGVPCRLTTLTLSERWLTTQTSLALRTATATGSRPTGTRAASCSPAGVTLKTSSVLLGVLTANSFVPSADRASGRTWPLSKAMKSGAAARAGVGAWVAIRPAHESVRNAEANAEVNVGRGGRPGPLDRRRRKVGVMRCLLIEQCSFIGTSAFTYKSTRTLNRANPGARVSLAAKGVRPGPQPGRTLEPLHQGGQHQGGEQAVEPHRQGGEGDAGLAELDRTRGADGVRTGAQGGAQGRVVARAQAGGHPGADHGAQQARDQHDGRRDGRVGADLLRQHGRQRGGDRLGGQRQQQSVAAAQRPGHQHGRAAGHHAAHPQRRPRAAPAAP